MLVVSRIRTSGASLIILSRSLIILSNRFFRIRRIPILVRRYLSFNSSQVELELLELALEEKPGYFRLYHIES